MNNNKKIKEPKLTYALDSSLSKLVYIEDVPNGLACNCFCPKCKEKLIARNGKDNVRQKHFAHRGDINCHGAVMTALHLLSEQILAEEKCVMAPAYKKISARKLVFNDVEIEQRNDRKDIQPDIVGVMEDGSRWLIEIRNTHEIDSDKRKKIEELNCVCLEIDVSEQELNIDSLRAFLVDSFEKREWINNPIYESLIADTELNNSNDESEECNIAYYLNSHQYDVKPLSECGLSCGFKLYNDGCIYKEREIIYEGIKHVVCNINKRLKDNEIPKSDVLQNDSSQIYQKEKNLPNKNSHTESLPFEPYTTIDEYYSQLIKDYHETELSYKAEILEFEKIGNKIILLCKDYFKKVCPFHIDKVFSNNGIIKRETIAIFSNVKYAKKNYLSRKKSMSLNAEVENTDDNLPF